MRRLYMDEYKPASGLIQRRHLPRTPRFPAIDMHAHLGPMLMGDGYASMYDTEAQAEKLRSCGLEKMVSLELVWGESYKRLREKLERAGDFFVIFPSVDIAKFGDPGFERETVKTIGEYRAGGVRAIKLWKNITLTVKNADSAALRLDDPRLAPVFAGAGEEGLPIVIHIGDPPPFFRENSETNEYYNCLREHPEWSFHRPGLASFEEHMEMQENLLGMYPKTTFVIAHVGSWSENLAQVAAWLDRFPNMNIDIAARIDQLGRQPYTAREFMTKYADRILFGTDYEPRIADAGDFYTIHYRFLETKDEYFDHPFESLGMWKIYGLGLDDDALRLIYRDNAARILKL